MPVEFLGITKEEATVIGAGIGAVVISVLAAIRGAQRKKPLPPEPTLDSSVAVLEDKIEDVGQDVRNLARERAQTADAFRERLGKIEASVSGLRDLLIEIRAKIN